MQAPSVTILNKSWQILAAIFGVLKVEFRQLPTNPDGWQVLAGRQMRTILKKNPNKSQFFLQQEIKDKKMDEVAKRKLSSCYCLLIPAEAFFLHVLMDIAVQWKESNIASIEFCHVTATTI